MQNAHFSRTIMIFQQGPNTSSDYLSPLAFDKLNVEEHQGDASYLQQKKELATTEFNSSPSERWLFKDITVTRQKGLVAPGRLKCK